MASALWIVILRGAISCFGGGLCFERQPTNYHKEVPESHWQLFRCNF
jgi:hypothetical protein